jgi:ribosomal 50S subunit-recycling heat shock protein
VKQRTEAARLLRDGRVLVDGRPVKPASSVRPGQRIRVEAGRAVTEWEVLEVPRGSVPRADRDRYARRTAERPREGPA